MHVVLGFVLDPERTGTVPAAPILVRGSLPLRSLWRGTGAIGPPPSLANGVEAIGALSLPANADGVIRRVPLFLGAGDRLLPGFASETVRLLRRAADYTLHALPSDGLLRLFPIGQDIHAARTISAIDLLQGVSNGASNSGRIADAV